MRVLVVDDEVIVVRALTRAFQSKGHQVDSAHSGEEGLEKWVETRPDAIMLDVVMPGLTGPQVIEEFMKRFEGSKQGAKVVLMTAHSGIRAHAEALELGADDFVQKPFDDVFKLVTRVEKLAGGVSTS
jgi:CheY-like chemotaxis protein